MLLAIALIVLGVISVAALELWLFWQLGEREDRRPARRRPQAPTSQRVGSTAQRIARARQ